MNKTILPIIKNVSATNVAQDICNVQPMIPGTANEVFTIKPRYANQLFLETTKEGHFAVVIRGEVTPRYVWCTETFGEEHATSWWVNEAIYYNRLTFVFKNEADRNWFTLKWE